jgi:serine/threonine-protein kinase RsbT
MHFIVQTETDVSTVRRQARYLAEILGFDRVASYAVATAVSELANNLVRHATRGGEIFLTELFNPNTGQRGMEIVARDEGPGIADPSLALKEGYSSNGGLGCGLPGVKRLMDEFELTVTGGTQVTVRKWLKILKKP